MEARQKYPQKPLSSAPRTLENGFPYLLIHSEATVNPPGTSFLTWIQNLEAGEAVRWSLGSTRVGSVWLDQNPGRRFEVPQSIIRGMFRILQQAQKQMIMEPCHI